MSYQHIPDDPNQIDTWLRDQKDRLTTKAISQLKTLFAILICTYLIMQLMSEKDIYVDRLFFFLFTCLIVADVGLIILFVIDMKRLIRSVITIYKRTHRSK